MHNKIPSVSKKTINSIVFYYIGDIGSTFKTGDVMAAIQKESVYLMEEAYFAN